jgi:hypothetical protein
MLATVAIIRGKATNKLFKILDITRKVDKGTALKDVLYCSKDAGELSACLYITESFQTSIRNTLQARCLASSVA